MVGFGIRLFICSCGLRRRRFTSRLVFLRTDRFEAPVKKATPVRSREAPSLSSASRNGPLVQLAPRPIMKLSGRVGFRLNGLSAFNRMAFDRCCHNEKVLKAMMFPVLFLPVRHVMPAPIPDPNATPHTPEESAAARRQMWKRGDAWALRRLRSWWFYTLVLPLVFGSAFFIFNLLIPDSAINIWARAWIWRTSVLWKMHAR